jgi:Tol biopolymer transport system component
MKTRLILIIAFILMAGFLSAQDNKASVALAAAIYEEEVTGNLDKAVELYLDILKKYPDDRQVAAKALYHLGLVNEKMGKQKANEYFSRLVTTYPDQTEMVALAKAKLAAIGSPGDNAGFVTRRILPDASGVGEILIKDGKYIRGLNLENGDVNQFEIASGQKTQIKNKGSWTDPDKESMYQAISCDGKQIAYDSYAKDWTPQLMIRNLDGSEIRTLHNEIDFNFYPFDWSPDGKFILGLLLKSGTNALALISTTDGSTRILRNIPSGLFMFDKTCFSPDGQYIAYSYIRDGNPPNGDVFLMHSDGKDEISIAGHPSEDRLLGWTPDGKNLLLMSDRSGTWDIWIIRITGGKQQGEPELLKKDFGYYSEFLGIAPDGSCYYRTNTRTGGLFSGLIDIETGKVLKSPSSVTTRYSGPPFQTKWSPDGKYLLYRSRVGSIGPGNNILTIRSEATGEERFLTPPLRFINQISWAPDGRSVLALGITEKENGIYRIDAETSATTKLTKGGRYAPRLCPDGKTLVFIKGGVMVITKQNLETGEESEVVKNNSLAYDISPDGKEVVFLNDNIVKTMSLKGGEPKELFSSSAGYFHLMWTRDNRYIIAMVFGAQTGDTCKIWRIPAQGGTPVKLDLFIPNLMFFALHPDNKHFVYSVKGETKSELWVMENFLPK